jgi:hypothetical protein
MLGTAATSSRIVGLRFPPAVNAARNCLLLLARDGTAITKKPNAASCPLRAYETRGARRLPGPWNTLLRDYARNFLTWSVISRPLAGEAPSIDLVLGYHKADNSPLSKAFLSRVDNMIDHVARSSGQS